MAGDRDYPRQYVSNRVSSNQMVITALIVLVSAADALLLGYDSAVIGSLNVMPTYKSYFTLTTATKDLLTSASYVGGGISSLPAGMFTDWMGRKKAVFASCCIATIGTALQASAQNIAMFIVGRILIGFGLGVAAVAVPIYVSEVAQEQWRPFCLGLYLALWPLGTILASCISWRTEQYNNNWSWRTPSLLQLLWPALCCLVLCFVPESPRWLIDKDRQQEALETIAIVNAGGDKSHPEVQLIYQEILDTIAYEKGEGRQKSLKEALVHPANRKRLIIVCTFSIPVMCAGSIIIIYYFTTILTLAGVTDPLTQLQVNIILQLFNLICAVLGAWLLGRVRRMVQMAISMAGCIVMFFVYAALVAVNEGYKSKSLTYGAIAAIFLWEGFRYAGMNCLISGWPPEILSYRIRAVGLGLYTFLQRILGVLVTLVFPIGMQKLGYKFYIFNACIDIGMLAFMLWYYVETSNLTLEEVDLKFEGVKHSNVPNLRDLKKAGGRQEMMITLEAIAVNAEPDQK